MKFIQFTFMTRINIVFYPVGYETYFNSDYFDIKF